MVVWCALGMVVTICVSLLASATVSTFVSWPCNKGNKILPLLCFLCPGQSKGMDDYDLFNVWVVVKVEEWSKDSRVVVLAHLNTT